MVKSFYISTYKNKKKQGKLRLRTYLNPLTKSIKGIYLEEKNKTGGLSNKKRYKIDIETRDAILKTTKMLDIKVMLDDLNIKVSNDYFSSPVVDSTTFQYFRKAWVFKSNSEEYRVTLDYNFEYENKNGLTFEEKIVILEIKCKDDVDQIFFEKNLNLFAIKFSKYKHFYKLIEQSYGSSLLEYNGIEDEIKIQTDYTDNYYTKLLETLKDWGFILKKRKNKHYRDIYFDTSENFLYKNDYSYRIRSFISAKENILNFKKPPLKGIDESYLSREEFKCILDDATMKSNISTLNCKINELLMLALSQKTEDVNIEKKFDIETHREMFDVFDLEKWIKGEEYKVAVLTIDHGEIHQLDIIKKLPIFIEIEFMLTFFQNHTYSEESRIIISKFISCAKAMQDRKMMITLDSKYKIATKLLQGAQI